MGSKRRWCWYLDFLEQQQQQQQQQQQLQHGSEAGE